MRMKTWTALCALAASGAVVGCAEEAAGPTAEISPGHVAAPVGDVGEFFDCLRETGMTLVIAHRGGPAPGYPENALETFERTVASAPALLEVDVATSSDGVLFLHHDDTLDRTTTGSGPFSEMTWAEIRSLQLEDNRGAKTAFHPTSLEDALEWSEGKAIFEIDFKRSTRYEDVVDLVRRTGATDRVIYVTYSLAQAEKLHRLHPEAAIAVTIERINDLDTAVARGIPADRIVAWTGNEAPDPSLYSALLARGVEPIFGTLGGRNSIDREIADYGDETRYREIADMGVVLISTDRAHEAWAALGPGQPEGGACGVTAR